MKRMQGEQVGISGDQDVSMAVNSDFQEFVIARITAGADRRWDVYMNAGADILCSQRSAHMQFHIQIEPATLEDLDQFKLRGV